MATTHRTPRDLADDTARLLPCEVDAHEKACEILRDAADEATTMGDDALAEMFWTLTAELEDGTIDTLDAIKAIDDLDCGQLRPVEV